MSSRSELERGLRSVLEILGDYASDLVLVGGWVPYLHLRYGRAAVPSARTSLTAEADLLIPTGLRRGNRLPIADILRQAGFEARGTTGVIWARKPDLGGETIEFLHPIRGPARNRGQPTFLDDQPNLRALSLDHLRVMQDFTETLTIAESTGGTVQKVRVPTLGGFVVNKSNTFNLRGGENARLKGGKDLLYLRDIMAAGDQAADVLEHDLSSIAAASDGHLEGRRRAAYHLRYVAPRYYGPAADILAERDGIDVAAARGDVEGYLNDILEVVMRSIQSEHEAR